MGGKKKSEKNRNYEKNRRDRFNDQFSELSKLLPDINSSVIKITKSEIIGRTIQYLKDTRTRNEKLENEFENEKSKISELQKKVAGLLQIIKELIKLLNKSNINFPASLPLSDFVSLRDLYTKSKKSKERNTSDKCKKRKISQEDENFAPTNSPNDSSDDKQKTDTAAVSNVFASAENRTNNSSSSLSTTTFASSTETVTLTQPKCTVATNLEVPILKLNSNLILPNGNLVAVNGLPNVINNNSTLLLNKQVTVPTLILMQNSIVPVQPVQTQRLPKLIVPKQTLNTTKTTFINKKPIPTVRLYRSQIAPKEATHRSTSPVKRKRSKRSKGILVKYPKRKPPTKNKKRIENKKLCAKKSIQETPTRDKNSAENDKNENFPSMENCYMNETFSENADINKTYNLFDGPTDPQNSNEFHSKQFIDFFDSSTRSIDNAGENNVVAYAESSSNTEKQKLPIQDNFNEHLEICPSIEQNSFVNANISNILRNDMPVRKDQNNLKEKSSLCVNELSSKNALNYLSTAAVTSTNDVLQSIESNFEIDKSSRSETIDKRKSNEIEKEIAPLTIHCDEPKSIPKELHLSFDDKKHYDHSFDEFSNDLFTSLQVPSNGHNADSISPTAAFLLTFPLVSSGKNVDLLPEHEEESSAATPTSTTILQIGNLESPPTLMCTSNKFPSSRDAQEKVPEKLNFCDKEDENFASRYCNTMIELQQNNERKEKLKDNSTKDELVNRSDVYHFGDASNFMTTNQQSKPSCHAKETTPIASQNMSFYPTSSNSSAFSSYNIFKYNEPATCASYYSLGSQPYPIAKMTDAVADLNSWPMYSQDEPLKEKTKRDKCTSTLSRNFVSSTTPTYGLSLNDVNGAAVAAVTASDRSTTKAADKKKSQKNRPLVNWMTSPDVRNASDSFQLSDVFALQQKDDGAYINSTNVAVTQNTFSNSYSSGDYFFENQNYDANNCKAYSSTTTSYSWSPSKSLPLQHLDTRSMIIPSTLPTLVGDLALGNSSFNNYDLLPKKYAAVESEKKKESCAKTYYKNGMQQQSSFLSVTQLVDDKDSNGVSKQQQHVPSSKSNKQVNADATCPFENESERLNYNKKTGYNATIASSSSNNNNNAANCNGAIDSKNTDKNIKSNQNVAKCKKDGTSGKNNNNVKKDNRQMNQQHQYIDGATTHNEICDNTMHHKHVTLTNKNSNYSAESLISTSNHQTCSSQSYFPYDNNTNYANCNNKRADNESTLANYYPNANYVYHNNFHQGFNNYGFSNQCYNNYGQIPSSAGFEKRKDNYSGAKQDADWYKATSFPNYNAIVSGDFNTQNKAEMKCKFSNNKYASQKNNNTYNTKYYQYGGTPSILPNKNSCSFNSAQTFGEPQQYSKTCTTNYDGKNRNNTLVNSNNNGGHSITSLTNFNLSAIFPEINDKHCVQNRINSVGSEKNDPKYNNAYKSNMEEINYNNYLIQPSVENSEPVSVYGSSGFQIQQFTEFTSKKTHK